MQNKQTQENTKHTNLRIPLETYEKIERLAKESERTISQQIRFIIEKYFQIIEK